MINQASSAVDNFDAFQYIQLPNQGSDYGVRYYFTKPLFRFISWTSQYWTYLKRAADYLAGTFKLRELKYLKETGLSKTSKAMEFTIRKINEVSLSYVQYNSDCAVENIKLLIDNGANVKARHKGFDPLTKALKAGNAGAVELFLKNGIVTTDEILIQAFDIWKAKPALQKKEIVLRLLNESTNAKLKAEIKAKLDESSEEDPNDYQLVGGGSTSSPLPKDQLGFVDWSQAESDLMFE